MKLMQRIKINEFGCSMIEIIGVLVIIGLLSSAGVVGYKSAHDTYRATSIMDTVMKGKLAVEADYRILALTSDSNAESMLKRATDNSSIIVDGDTVSVTERQIGSKTYKIFTIDTTESAGVCEKIVLRQSLYNSSDDENAKTGISITPDNVESCGEEGEIAMRFSFNVFVQNLILTKKIRRI